MEWTNIILALENFPKTLDDFKQKYGDWDSVEGFWVTSAAKCERRGLFALNENVYIAETEVDGWVRETENCPL